MNISTLLPLQGKERFGGFSYVHTNYSMNIVARDWYTPIFQRTSTELPLTKENVWLIDKAVDLLAKAEGLPELQATGRVLERVRKRLVAILNFG